MTTTQIGSAAPALRDQLISDPGIVLDDPDILRALVGAEEAARGTNVRDMRGLAMQRLESRLDALENQHQNVIAAAYYNVSTTSQVHRAILTMIAPTDFDAFLENLDTHVADCLRIRAVRLVMEAETENPDSDLNPISGALSVLPAGGVAQVQSGGSTSARRYPVILRQVGSGAPRVYGTAAADIRSEAVVQLNLGETRAPGLLVLGADDPGHFAPGQATDLLELFARVCERLVRGWLG
ncbi:DUF484 domain-containing protein [Meridianimarinicoccus roseus]|jgi:hypothetical protein|uniref:DUF484 domain-containing protein n=1 Tax=Meridianimarinicoccus roseus TaxID=2072018 RepID=A0A2V2LED3_9RHOB|nr:DUF484 family protein [Meridianimarinicoccus roseus]PWR03938.1 DUF484 domain-containing protein [Meridianimarinicoccus roseus]